MSVSDIREEGGWEGQKGVLPTKYIPHIKKAPAKAKRSDGEKIVINRRGNISKISQIENVCALVFLACDPLGYTYILFFSSFFRVILRCRANVWTTRSSGPVSLPDSYTNKKK